MASVLFLGVNYDQKHTCLQRVHCALHKEPSYDFYALLPYLFVYHNIWVGSTKGFFRCASIS